MQYTILIVEEDKRNSKLPGEKIDYNERFWWTWDQGRFGFGPYCKFTVLTKTLHTCKLEFLLKACEDGVFS
jgi:hypothetical protein